MSTFPGFPPDAWAFLSDLEIQNTKAFFDANRHRYDDGIAGPAKELVEALALILPDRLGADVRAEPKIGRSLFRINRDTRFAADKTPYKTYIDVLFWVGDGPPRSRPAWIMRITADEVLVGGGQMGVAGAAREAYRNALDDRVAGLAIRTSVDQLVAAGAELSGPDRAKPPRPFAAEHPNADLLRRDGFHLSTTAPHPASIGSPGFVEWCADALAPFAPIVTWFDAIDAQGPSSA
jgi:uncharacterized protein (TIGR02453 family)